MTCSCSLAGTNACKTCPNNGGLNTTYIYPCVPEQWPITNTDASPIITETPFKFIMLSDTDRIVAAIDRLTAAVEKLYKAY